MKTVTLKFPVAGGLKITRPMVGVSRLTPDLNRFAGSSCQDLGLPTGFVKVSMNSSISRSTSDSFDKKTS